MLITPHLVTGAAIAVVSPNPFVSIQKETSSFWGLVPQFIITILCIVLAY